MRGKAWAKAVHVEDFGFRVCGFCVGSLVPIGSYSTPFLGRLLFKITDPNHKTRYPKKGVGYEPLGNIGFTGVYGL